MSWQKVKLGSILTESKVISENPDTNKRITVRLKVLGVEKRGVENEVSGATKQFIRRKGQFIFGKQNFHKGAFGIVPEELDGFESSSDLPAFDIDKSCLPEFLFYFFKQGNYYLELSKIAYGVATQRINMKEFYELEIPLPNIEIQKQIINQFKILEKSGGEISSELTHQLDLIKQLRQAFLREAMQGKLVRSSELGVGSETGHELLAKIKVEKAQLIAEKKLKKEKELPPITADEIPFEIPEHWAWCRLGDYFSVEKGLVGIQKAIDGEFPLVVTGAQRLSHNEFHFEGKAVIIPTVSSTGHGHASLKRIHYQEGKFAVGNILACIMPLMPKYFNMKFICNYLDTYKEFFFVEKMKGAANVSLKISSIKETPIPLIPIEFQNKYEYLMAFCDGLEERIKESQGYNEKLLQQVLREALQPQ